MNQDELQAAIRDEMRGVMSEMSQGKHKPMAGGNNEPQAQGYYQDDQMNPNNNSINSNVSAALAAMRGGRNNGQMAATSASPARGQGGAPSALNEKVQQYRERISILEDALAKSEADRAAVYARCEQSERALQIANEEKMALLHEYHDASAGPVNEVSSMLQQCRIENERMSVQLEEIPRLRLQIKEQEKELKKLRKLKDRALEERAEGVTLSDLHFSNERLSAQLAKLQAPSKEPIFDENKFRECESAILGIANDVAQFETKIIHMQQIHAMEKQQLQDQLDRQFQEFSVERAECDRVVGIMSAKLEALVAENNALKKSARGSSRR